jgi:disulfide bond formation protein DsbB
MSAFPWRRPPLLPSGWRRRGLCWWCCFGLFGLLMLYNTGLAAYHSGVEWGFWEGPASCSQSALGGSAADMLNQLGTVTPASCTEAVWRFFGLSFAGWNVLISALLSALGLAAARLAWRQA